MEAKQYSFFLYPLLLMGLAVLAFIPFIFNPSIVLADEGECRSCLSGCLGQGGTKDSCMQWNGPGQCVFYNDSTYQEGACNFASNEQRSQWISEVQPAPGSNNPECGEPPPECGGNPDSENEACKKQRCWPPCKDDDPDWENPNCMNQTYGQLPGGFQFPGNTFKSYGQGILTAGGGIIFGIAVLKIIFGGVMYATAAGNPQRITEAKSHIAYALIGIALIVGMNVILLFLGITAY